MSQLPAPRRLIRLLCLLVIVLAGLGLRPSAAPAQAGLESRLPAPEDAPLYTLYHPYFPKEAGGQTATIYIMNPNTSPLAVTLRFYRADGVTGLEQTIPARGLVSLAATQVSGLPDGEIYRLEAIASQPFESVARILLSPVNPDRLAIYRGHPGSGGATQFFGPYLPAYTLWLWNVSSQVSNLTIEYYPSSGGAPLAQSLDLNPGAALTLQPAGLAADFIGWARVSSSQPFAGLLVQVSGEPGNETYEYSGPLGYAETLAPLARAMKNFDDGPGPRTSTLLLGNPGSFSMETTLDLYQADGNLAASLVETIPAGGVNLVNLANLPYLVGDRLWAASLYSGAPALISEQSRPDQPGGVSASGYSARADNSNRLTLPRLVRACNAHTAFNLFNPGDSETTVTIDYYRADGSLAYSQPAVLPPRGWVRYNMQDIKGLRTFMGSAQVAATLPLAAWVDEYGPFICQFYLPITPTYQKTYFTGPLEEEPNNSYLDANGPLISGADYYGYPNDARDYFSFELLETTPIQISLQGHTGNGVQLQLFYRSTSNRVAFVYSPPYQVNLVGQPGWYYIYIYTASGYNSNSTYTLRAVYE
jgi:hypothetical protein